MELKIILMDQGGSFMAWNTEGIVGTLRSQMDGHPPVIVLEEDETSNIDREKIL